MKTMNRFVLSALAGAIALPAVAAAPAQAGVVGPMTLPTTMPTKSPSAGNLVENIRYRGRRRFRRGVGIGAGIVTLGILGAIAANRAHSRPYYYDDYDNQCQRWRRWCNRGNDRACWRFDTRC